MSEESDPELSERIAAVRLFNRFYTQQIGVLHRSLSRSPFSLTEARILYELAHREGPTASELGEQLGLDPGYLSRILASFARHRLLTRKRSTVDGRRTLLKLTKQGEAAFAALNQGAQQEVAGWLCSLAPSEQRELIGSMEVIERLLNPSKPKEPFFILRPHRAGDIGWIVQQHGIIYAQEYGWDERFEGLVARIAADFLETHDPKRERCWIAEREGQNVGCVFLVAKSKTVAQLRLLLVTPRARGGGVGERLVRESIQFARNCAYRKILLWTNDVLAAARHIYEKTGFRMVDREPHESFGVKLVGETWELILLKNPGLSAATAEYAE